jgi:hypothetical protein
MKLMKLSRWMMMTFDDFDDFEYRVLGSLPLYMKVNPHPNNNPTQTGIIIL